MLVVLSTWVPRAPIEKRLLTNQLQQQPKAFEGLLNSLREQIEGVFNEVQNTDLSRYLFILALA